jgi:poly-gamma-glutamate synthesis protein (capsule biosynthesis protein)
MLKGIEVYKNRAILYSIGNFAFDSHPKAVDTIWYSRRRKVYQGLLKVPEKDAKSKYHFQPESRYSMIAKIAIENRRIRQVSFVPVVINGEAQPEPFSASAREGEQVVTYVRDISSEAGLNAEIKVSGDEAVITGVNGI